MIIKQQINICYGVVQCYSKFDFCFEFQNSKLYSKQSSEISLMCQGILKFLTSPQALNLRFLTESMIMHNDISAHIKIETANLLE